MKTYLVEAEHDFALCPIGTYTSLRAAKAAAREHLGSSLRPLGGGSGRSGWVCRAYAAERAPNTFVHITVLRDDDRRLRDARVAAGKSLREAAAELGVTPTQLGEVERGGAKPQTRGRTR